MRPFLIPFLLFFLPCSLLQAQGFRQESSVLPKTGTQIKVESAFSALGSWGYYPVTVTLRNESSNDSTFSLKTNSDSSAPTYGMGEARSIETKANFNLSCPAGSEKSFDLLLPISMASFGYNGRYFGSGNDDETENSLHLEFKSGNEKWSTSVSGEHDLSKYSKVYSIATAPKVTTTSARLINTLNPKLLPVSLQAMSGYDDLLLSEADWNSLKEEAKSSLITWVEQGGQLAVIGEKGTSRTLATLLEKELKLSPFNKKGGLFLHTLNNGSIWTGSLENLKTIENRLNATERTKVQLNDLKNGYDDKSGSKLKWPIHQKLGVKKFDTIIIALLLVVFTIIVGPINFFVFAKQGKRHRLFFTTPLISLGMSALLIGYIVVKDGFGGKGHRILLKDINQEANSSFVIQEQISRTGMLFSSTFEMDNDLTIVQVPIKSSRWARVTNTKSTSKEMYTINRGDSTSTHNGNYFSSRSEQGHVITGRQITQESINVSSNSGSPEVTSTLADTLETLYFDLNGEFYIAKNLTTGNSVTAKKITEDEYRKWYKDMSQKFSKEVGNIFNRLSSRGNSYVAFAPDSNGIDTNTSISWDSETLITGTFNPNTSN